MTQPWCPGSGRAIPVPSTQAWDADHWSNCPTCGSRLKLRAGAVPKHRRRGCMVAGCVSPQTGGGLCLAHNREIVGVPE